MKKEIVEMVGKLEDVNELTFIYYLLKELQGEVKST